MKNKKDFISKEWESVASANDLDTFAAIWSLDIGWFEEPNQRRGGWSGVSRHEILLADGSREGVFIKRQQNHTTRTGSHPIGGINTFRREWNNIQKLQGFGVPTLDVLYFAEQVVDGERCAILISRELAGYRSLEELMASWQRDGWPERRYWLALISYIAGVARKMHQHRMQHNCFLPKHVFVREQDGKLDIRLIDFEKAKRKLRVAPAMIRDLDTFNRRSPSIRTTDRLRFLLAYLGKDRVDAEVRTAWRPLVALMRRKGRNLF